MWDNTFRSRAPCAISSASDPESTPVSPSVCIDADGTVVVAVEAERETNDFHRAVPADFDKIAACDPAEAIWVTMIRRGAHRVLEVLHDPPDGEPRVEKTYTRNTPPQSVAVDTPGLTVIYTAEHVRDQMLE